MKSLRAIFCFADWDSNVSKKKDDFCNECRKYNIAFEMMNVDDNVEFTTRHSIKNVPAIVLLHDKKIIGIEKGNNGYKNIVKYLHK